MLQAEGLDDKVWRIVMCSGSCPLVLLITRLKPRRDQRTASDEVTDRGIEALQGDNLTRSGDGRAFLQ